MSPWKQATEQILEYAPTDMNDPHLQRYADEAMGGKDGMPGNHQHHGLQEVLAEQAGVASDG